MGYFSNKEQNEAEWNEHIKDFLKSGMNRVEYCQKYDLNQQTFLSWLGRHYEKTSNLIPVRLSDKHLPTKTSLCELELNNLKITIHDKSVLGEELSVVIKALVSNATTI